MEEVICYVVNKHPDRCIRYLKSRFTFQGPGNEFLIILKVLPLPSRNFVPIPRRLSSCDTLETGTDRHNKRYMGNSLFSQTIFIDTDL